MAGEVCQELERLLRAQRHEFINHTQVIHAMLQLGRVEKALRYIEDLARDPGLVEEPLSMHTEQQTCRLKTGL